MVPIHRSFQVCSPQMKLIWEQTSGRNNFAKRKKNTHFAIFFWQKNAKTDLGRSWVFLRDRYTKTESYGIYQKNFLVRPWNQAIQMGTDRLPVPSIFQVWKAVSFMEGTSNKVHFHLQTLLKHLKTKGKELLENAFFFLAPLEKGPPNKKNGTTAPGRHTVDVSEIPNNHLGWC